MARTIATRTILLAGLLAGSAFAQKTPDEARSALAAGNARFAAGHSVAQPLGPGVRRTLARGQNPYAIVLCCADSRVPPEHVFNAGLGELFVVRVAGNCVDPEALASIEYAAEHLGTQLLVVLGHERCGAIAACAQGLEQAMAGAPRPAESPALQQLLESLEPAVRRAEQAGLGGRERTDRAEEENAQGMAVECLRRSQLLRQLQKLGRFEVLPARYHLDSGVVEWLPPRPLPPETPAAAPVAHLAAPSMAPHVALRLLQAGHRRFLGDGRPIGDIGPERRAALTAGQQPFAIVVTCSDSRVPPEHVFDAGLGDLFVIRVAGNVLNADVLASIEYAAAHTGAPLLLVLGHTSCGAVTAAVEHGNDPNLTPNLRALVERLQPAVEHARRAGATAGDVVANAVKANAQRFVAAARTQSSILRQLEHEGHLAMLPAVYDLATGDIEWLKDVASEAANEPPAAAPHAAPAGETNHDLDWADDHAPAHDAAPAHHGHDAGSDGGHGSGQVDGQLDPHETADPHAHAGHDEQHHEPAVDAHADGHTEEHADAHTGDHDHLHPTAPESPQHAAAANTSPAAMEARGANPAWVLGATGLLSLLAAAAIAWKSRS